MEITAEEVIQKNHGDKLGLFTREEMKEFAVAYAKLHVIRALKAASEKAEIHSDSGSNYHREFEEGVRNRAIWIPRNSILTAYPLENIK